MSAAKTAAPHKRGGSRPADGSCSTLKVEVVGRIATITLNRPERLNAINDAMPGEIRQRWTPPMPTTGCT